MNDELKKAIEEIIRNVKKIYEESVAANSLLVEKAPVCCTSSDPEDTMLEVYKKNENT